MGQKHSFYTDNEGCVNLQVDWNPGEYYILIENPATQDLCLKKINILPQIESTDLVKQYKNTTSFTVRILGLDGLPVSAGKTVTFKINGNNTNDTYICQAIASLLLGEIESKALGLTGRESKSSLNTILTEILNGRNYTIILNNETLTIKLEENENCTWLYDINSGLIYDLSNYNNFTYKGAISTNITTNCPFLFSEILYNNFDKELNIEFSDRDKKEIAKIGAAASLTLASATIPSIISTLPIIFAGVATAPVWMPLIVGTSLVLLGYALYLYANDGNYQNAIGDTFTDLVFNMVV